MICVMEKGDRIISSWRSLPEITKDDRLGNIFAIFFIEVPGTAFAQFSIPSLLCLNWFSSRLLSSSLRHGKGINSRFGNRF